MMQLLVVDDEQEIRDYIASLPGWKALGCTVAGTAANGSEALEAIERAAPDVLITDIRMPVMDGIALAEKVRQRHPDMPIVFLTAYHEFEYAQKAVKLGAADFITKPFVPEDLLVVVRQLQLQQKFDWQHQEAYFNLFSKPDEPRESKLQWLREHGVQDEPFVLLYAETDKSGEAESDRALFKQRQLLSSIRPVLDNSVIPYWLCNALSGVYIVLLCGAVGEARMPEEAMKLARSVSDACDDEQGRSFSVGISHPHASLLKLPDAIEEAARCMEYRMLLGKKSVIAYAALESILAGREKDTLLSIDRLADLLRTDDRDGIRDVLKESYRRMLQAGVEKREIQYFCIGVIEKAEAVLKEAGVEPDPGEALNIRGKMLSGVVLTDMMRELEDKLLVYADRLGETYRLAPRRLAAEIKHMIEHEYMQDLTLQTVAQRLHINYSYLSRLIKKEFGSNFTELLWNYRIEAAKARLVNEDSKIYEIAYAVGFKDSAHFSLLFKKATEMSPSAYKLQSRSKMQ